MNLFTLWLAAALLMQSASAKPPAPPAELRFAWPKDLTARVETEKTRERQTKSTTTTTARASYRLRLLPHREGFMVQHDSFQIDGVPPAQLAALSETVTSMMPNLVVDASGEFRRVENIATLKAGVESLFAPLRSKGQMPQGLDDFMSKFLTEKTLTALAAQEWQLLVGTWREMPLTIEKFEVEIEEPSPIWPDIKIPMKVSGGMIGKEACLRGNVSFECAVFEMRSTFDQTAMRPILQRFTESLLRGVKDAQDFKYEHLDVVTVVRVRLETDTMVPHELSTTRTIETTMSVPVEGRAEVKQIDRRTSRFSY